MSADIVTVIEARPTTIAGRMRALWQYRAFYPFLFKEVTTRKFRGTMLGFWWLVIRPLVPTVMAVVTFTNIVPMANSDLPYVVFYFSGFLTWNVFHAMIVFMPRTLGWMQSTMRRTYFPKLLVPLASLGPPLLETAIMLVLFAVAVIYYKLTKGTTHIVFGWNLLWFLPAFFMAMLLGWSIGVVTSVIALFVRDIIFTVSYFAQIFMFVTPVLYPATFVPEKYRWALYVVNPMADLVELSRWSLTGTGDFHPLFVMIAFVVVLTVTALCIGFFLRAERFMADEM
jgi:lipopolysaccharide transport system permease protein